METHVWHRRPRRWLFLCLSPRLPRLRGEPWFWLRNRRVDSQAAEGKKSYRWRRTLELSAGTGSGCEMIARNIQGKDGGAKVESQRLVYNASLLQIAVMDVSPDAERNNRHRN
jgi:hypothetical protein